MRRSAIGGAPALVEADRAVAALDPDTFEVLRRPFPFDQREDGAQPAARRVLRVTVAPRSRTAAPTTAASCCGRGSI